MPKYFYRVWQILRVPEVEYISYNIGTHAVPDILYARCLREYSARGRVHIYQAKHSCLCYNLYIYYILSNPNTYNSVYVCILYGFQLFIEGTKVFVFINIWSS